MRPFGKFYSTHCSVHMKWRVATHSDHSCCGRVSEGPRCCNLICLSCKVKAFIISARGIRCHLHWTWHVHAPLAMGDHTHTHTHTHTHVQVYIYNSNHGRQGWEMRALKKRWTEGLRIYGWWKSQGQSGLSLLWWSRWWVLLEAKGHTHTHTRTQTHIRPIANDSGLLFSREGRVMGKMKEEINGTACDSVRLYVMSSAQLPPILHTN